MNGGVGAPDGLRGAVVTHLDIALIKDLYEFRGALERYVAGTLASRSRFDAAAMREIVALRKAAAEAGDLSRWIDLDLRFHTRLYDMVGNRALTETMSSYWIHTRRVMAATLKEAGYSQMAWDELGARRRDVRPTSSNGLTSSAPSDADRRGPLTYCPRPSLITSCSACCFAPSARICWRGGLGGRVLM